MDYSADWLAHGGISRVHNEVVQKATSLIRKSHDTRFHRHQRMEGVMPKGWVVEAITRQAGSTLIMHERYAVAIADA